MSIKRLAIESNLKVTLRKSHIYQYHKYFLYRAGLKSIKKTKLLLMPNYMAYTLKHEA